MSSSSIASRPIGHSLSDAASLLMQVEKIVSQAPWGARRAARSLTLRATCWWSPTLYAGRVEGSVGDGGESRGSGSVSLRRLWLASRKRRALSRWANVLRSPYCRVFTPSPAPAVPRGTAQGRFLRRPGSVSRRASQDRVLARSSGRLLWQAMQWMQTAMDSSDHGQRWPADELTGM